MMPGASGLQGTSVGKGDRRALPASDTNKQLDKRSLEWVSWPHSCWKRLRDGDLAKTSKLK